MCIGKWTLSGTYEYARYCPLPHWPRPLSNHKAAPPGSLLRLRFESTVSPLPGSRAGKDMLLPNGQAPQEGQIMKMPKLAATFRRLAAEGRDGFYKGGVAQAIVDVITAGGGCMTLEDLEVSGWVGSSVCPLRTPGMVSIFVLGQHICDASVSPWWGMCHSALSDAGTGLCSKNLSAVVFHFEKAV